MQRQRIALLGAQLLATLLALALLPTNLAKVAILLVIWAATFGRLRLPEIVLFAIVNVLFTAMNLGALHQGVFYFARPDFLGMPVWEYFMWGFYVLHLIRMV